MIIDMATSKHTFCDIFNSTFENDGGEPIELKKIVIPIIQRDYAQGRDGVDIKRIRYRFLNALKDALLVEPITLDFIYGDIDDKGILTPLDGQQRLTTLFLLHWYAAKVGNIVPDEYQFLKNFSYETRYSARDFCERLIDYDPDLSQVISEEIIDQSWFPLDWKKDPTIHSMLVVLDSIQEVFADVNDIWGKLNGNAISFYFLPIKDMGLTDELYIKMNSRGKPLTRFEHFKAELERNLREISNDIAERIIRKIDIDWMNMLWRYRGSDNVVDDEFLRYFRFICDIICYQENDTPQGKSMDEFDLLDLYFSKGKESATRNVLTLESYFDCWCNIEASIDAFFDSFLTHEHTIGKVVIDSRYQVNLFKDCLKSYADVMGNGNRQFSLNKIILLYAVVVYLLNKDSISWNAFVRRMRIINNLVMNSEYEISDSTNREGGNRMPSILRQVDSIVLTGNFMIPEEVNFNVNQIAEEKQKMLWLDANPTLAEDLYRAEDNVLLYGQVYILGLDNSSYFEKFIKLFNCDKKLIAKALLTFGDYSQTQRNSWKYQFGSSRNKSWTNLFHRSGAIGIDNTSVVLKALLDSEKDFTDEYLLSLINNYLNQCVDKNLFDWRYYMIKYPSFTPDRYGMYYWENRSKPYEFSVMWSERMLSSKAYQPFLYELDNKNISQDDNGQSIVKNNRRITVNNNEYIETDVMTGEILREVTITQNEDGIDIEDRIQKAIHEFGMQ
jgi:hypothetical protein